MAKDFVIFTLKPVRCSWIENAGHSLSFLSRSKPPTVGS